MIHRMKLDNEPFVNIKSGIKKIEIRLNDEKRQKIKVSDYIEFTNVKTLEIIYVKVTNLYKFSTFEELFKNFDALTFGDCQAKDMYLYYSVTDEVKYGALALELKYIKSVKQIIHNDYNLTLNEVTKTIRRAKLIVENNKGEILLCHLNNNYFLVGGHVENDETDENTLIREVKEETGVLVDVKNLYPIANVSYINKDYPEKNMNTYTSSNYYYIKCDLIPNKKNMDLTKDELSGNFQLIYIQKNGIIDFLEESLETCSRKGTLQDTIFALKAYFDIQK